MLIWTKEIYHLNITSVWNAYNIHMLIIEFPFDECAFCTNIYLHEDFIGDNCSWRIRTGSIVSAHAELLPLFPMRDGLRHHLANDLEGPHDLRLLAVGVDDVVGHDLVVTDNALTRIRSIEKCYFHDKCTFPCDDLRINNPTLRM